MEFAYLCHAADDSAAVRDLGEYLIRNSSWDIRYFECDDLVEAAEQAMAAAVIILVLSPASAPFRCTRERWEPVLLKQPALAGVRLATVLLRDCQFPALLRRRDFFDGPLNGRRALKRWLLDGSPRIIELPDGPADVTGAAMEELRCALVDSAGVSEDLPVETARAFARECRRDFEGVIWLDCARRTRSGVLGDLSYILGRRLTGTADEDADQLRELCASRRLLLIFDNCDAPLFPREGKCSIIRTSPRQAALPRAVEDLARLFVSWRQNEPECLNALRDVGPALQSGGNWEDLRAIGKAAVALLRSHERAAELIELLELLVEAAWEHGDESALDFFKWEQGWILNAWNRPVPVRSAVLAPDPGDQLTLEFHADQ